MKLLIVVDAQNDFIDGALRNEEAIKRVPNIVEEIKTFDGDFIFLTQDTHYEKSDDFLFHTDGYFDTLEGKKLNKLHCVKGSQGWEINKDVLEAVKDKPHTFIQKNTFGYDCWRNAIYQLRNVGILEVLNLEDKNLEIELIGYCTDICVISNAMLLKAFYPNAIIKIKESCCAGVDKQGHDEALRAMQRCHMEII